jgi:hypothetical protein
MVHTHSPEVSGVLPEFLKILGLQAHYVMVTKNC